MVAVAEETFEPGTAVGELMIDLSAVMDDILDLEYADLTQTQRSILNQAKDIAARGFTLVLSENGDGMSTECYNQLTTCLSEVQSILDLFPVHADNGAL